MKYQPPQAPIPQSKRKELNKKVLSLIDSGNAAEFGITQEDIFNAYTGDGGLHGLERKDFDNYRAYSEAKKEIENGQFFTPPRICELAMKALKLSDTDLAADLTCGKGSFFNFMSVESNAYGCELDVRAYKVARYAFPDAHLTLGNLRTYQPDVRFDYVVGNPPFNINWWDDDGVNQIPSHLYYCQKAARLLKPLGILALIVPCSFLADSFKDQAQIREMEKRYSFLGQLGLPENAFAALGVSRYATKLQFWQRRSEADGWKPHAYHTEIPYTLPDGFNIEEEAALAYEKFVRFAKAGLEENSLQILRELAKEHASKSDFDGRVQQLLYHIKDHPKTRPHYPRCCEYLHRFYTQVQPADMPYETWCQKRLTEAKVLAYLKKALSGQSKPPERDEIGLIKQGGQFAYKGYSAKVRRQMADFQKQPVPVYRAILDNDLTAFPGYARLLRRKRAEYERQEQPFAAMTENPGITQWLAALTLYDTEKEKTIRLNEKQQHDINLVLQKRYAMLQWAQGSGKTLAGIAMGLYRMQRQNVHSTWVVSSAISIRNNWNVVLPNYRLPFVFVERLKDLERIRPGDFVLITLNKVREYQKQIMKKVKLLGRNIQLVLDESDEISNADSACCKAVLACFRRCRFKLLTTGTSTRNNISEFAPQLELLYNNSIHMISWAPRIYKRDADAADGITSAENPCYGQPIPAYKKGYSLFAASHLPEHITVFGLEKRTQDIYNASTLNRLIDKTVITRTFEEIVGRDIARIHQVPVSFAPSEKAVYQQVIDEFHKLRDGYFASTNNARKDAMMKLVQQLVLLLRVSAAPDTLAEYTGDTPVKIMTAVEMAADWPDEIIAVGVRHKNVLASYAAAFREYLPDRPLFSVTGSEVSFAKRRALRKTLKESKDGILLCTQQSLPSSVNFEYVNKVIIPELHYNNSRMSQFYSRFIRYDSTEFKDIYFLTYAGSIESNLMQMILCKEKLNLFMKGQDVDLDEIYERFDVNYDLLSLMMRREADEEGKLQIRWGEQRIA